MSKILLSQKRLITLLVLSLSMGSLLWSGSAPQTGSDAERVITDMRGREVGIPDDIGSIIALNAGSLRLLSYFDAVDKVIAVEDSGHGREISIHEFFYLASYRIAHQQLQDLPSIGSSENHEAIIARDPDIVFSSHVDISQLNQLQDVLDIPVVAIDADVELDDPERFIEQLRLVGSVLHENQRVEELASGIQDILADIDERKEQRADAKKAYAGGMMYYGPADLLRTTGDYLPFELTGTENVMPTNPSGNRQPYMTSIEHLIEADPQYVFIDAANNQLSKRGFLEHKNVFAEHVTAFRNKDVYNTLVYKYYGTNWENQLANIYYAGKVMYPEVYRDVEIIQKTEKIWELFFQVSLDYQTVIELQGPGFGQADWF